MHRQGDKFEDLVPHVRGILPPLNQVSVETLCEKNEKDRRSTQNSALLSILSEAQLHSGVPKTGPPNLMPRYAETRISGIDERSSLDGHSVER